MEQALAMTPYPVYAPAMPGQPGLPNLVAMRGRRKGGVTKSQAAIPLGIASHASAFLSHLTARAYSPASIEAHRWALRQFAAWADSREIHDPAACIRADLEEYQRFLHQYRSPRNGQPLVVNTQLARLGCVRRFFAWLCRTGTIPANPAADLDLPRKQARALPKALNPQEIQALLAVPNPDDPFGLRDRAILELFYSTGIRRSEMTRLDLGDYDGSTNTLLVRKGKGGKSRMLPIGERAAAWLDLYLIQSRPHFHHLPQQTALFLSGYGSRITPNYLGNWIKKLMIRCGIDKPGSCHLFRHSCATDIHRGGADICYVQEMLGHARMETTQIYTHVHIDALREIHTRCHPHGRLNQLEVPEVLELPTRVKEEPQLCASSAPSADQGPLRHDFPSDDDPTAGSAPAPGNQPPPNGRPSARYPILDNSETPPKSPEIQAFRSGVTYYGYRFYDPVTGRWPSRDPIEEAGGVNIYQFVENAGVNSWDYLGMQDFLNSGDGWGGSWPNGDVSPNSDYMPVLQPDPYPVPSAVIVLVGFQPLGGLNPGQTYYEFDVNVQVRETKPCCLEGEVKITGAPYIFYSEIIRKKRAPDKSKEEIIAHERRHVSAINRRMQAIAEEMHEYKACYESPEYAAEEAVRLNKYFKDLKNRTTALEEAHTDNGNFGTPGDRE